MEHIKRLPLLGAYALLTYMPFHVFLSQSVSLLTGGLPAWKIAKDVFTLLLVIITVICVWTQRKKVPQWYWAAAGLALLYALIHGLTYFFNQDTGLRIAMLASVYNNRLLWYFLIGAGALILHPSRTFMVAALRLVIVVSTIVSLLAVVQYFLPKDVLTHVGYSVSRGVKPAFFIDDKPDLPRVMSTIRDPNSLGAFLVVPVTVLILAFNKADNRRRMLVAGLLGLHGLALLLTFSRGSWLAMMISVCVALALWQRALLLKYVKRFWLVGVTGLLLFGGVLYAFRDQYVVQNIIFHSDETTRAELDSNELHADFVSRGLRGIARDPLGHGPGTAGIVAIQNPSGGLLTENYYVQIGFEAGLLGLLVFIAVLLWVYRLLGDGLPATALRAAFWGYVVANLVAHTWSNEAVAAQWWLLAGMVAASASAVAESRAGGHGKADRRAAAPSGGDDAGSDNGPSTGRAGTIKTHRQLSAATLLFRAANWKLLSGQIGRQTTANTSKTTSPAYFLHKS